MAQAISARGKFAARLARHSTGIIASVLFVAPIVWTVLSAFKPAAPNLTEAESAIGLFWQDRFTAREWLLIKPGETEAELARFKKETLRRLRSADAARRAARIQSEAAPGPRGAGA